MKKIYFLALAALLLAACKTETKVPVLTIEGGQVQGVTTDIKGVVAYKGIPYAAPPIGELRWKEPQPVVPWDGVLQADRFGHPGYQAVHYPGGYFTEWGYGEEAQCSANVRNGQHKRRLPRGVQSRWAHAQMHKTSPSYGQRR